ncbi:hypothetical protein GF325_16900 [Candidatus Bathyarchaeota archaeon]|nr:hypothetical protein [Candidatus Bathyarchaeota archaeon]
MVERNPEKRNSRLADMQVDYELEISREVKKNLQFLMKELDFVDSKEDLDRIIGEILFIGATSKEVKIRAYIHRKLRKLSSERPDMFKDVI